MVKHNKSSLRRSVQPSPFGRRTLAVVLGGAALIGFAKLSAGPSEAADIKQVVKTAASANADGAKAQNQVDKLADSTQSLLSEYEAVLQQTEALSAYNAQLATLVESQNKELTSLEEQLGRVTVVSRALTPLMLNMIEALDSFVGLDVPFLMKERQERVAKLRTTMDQSDVAESEKFRQLIEAYQIETDYGRTIEAYTGEVDLDGTTRTVEFLRIGRVFLGFQSLDGELVGHWDTLQKKFVELDDSHKPAIRYGLRVANKQRAPDDLLTIPLVATAAKE